MLYSKSNDIELNIICAMLLQAHGKLITDVNVLVVDVNHWKLLGGEGAFT